MGGSVWNPNGPLTPAEVASLQAELDALELLLAPYLSIVPTTAGLALLDDVNATAQIATLGLSASSGSSNIGFIQSGIGAISRTSQSKMRETVSVLDFGAVGNGVADDTVSIQAAITSLPAYGGAVYFPSGIYKTTATVTINKSCTLYGDGTESTVIRSFSSAGNIFTVTSIGYNKFCDLSIDRDASIIKSVDTAGIEINENNNGTSNSNKIVERCKFVNMYTDINIIDAIDFSFTDNVHINFLFNGITVAQKDVLEDHGTGKITGCKFWDVSGTIGGNAAISWYSSSGLRITNCRFLGQFKYGVQALFNKTTSDDGAMFISNNLFERQKYNGIRIQRNTPAVVANTKIGQIIISNNHFQIIDSGYENGIALIGSSPGNWIKGIVIADNVIQNALNNLLYDAVFLISDGSGVSISDNVIYHEGTGDGGIVVNGYAVNPEIKNNTFYGGTFAKRYPDTTATTVIEDSFENICVGRVSNIQIGAVAYSSLGTSAIHVAGTLNVAELQLPAYKSITGIGVLNGSVVGTDNIIVALYSKSGELLANSALAGTLSAGANVFQEIPFTAVKRLPAGSYLIAVQLSGTTAQTRRIAVSTYLNRAGTQAGTFGTLPAITPPTGTITNAGPIAYLY